VVTFWQAPEGVRVLPDGTWRVGGFPIIHAPSLRHLKSCLVFTDDSVCRWRWRVAHQVLLDNLIQADGAFFLSAGPRTIPVHP
jgi:hypothetical protein